MSIEEIVHEIALEGSAYEEMVEGTTVTDRVKKRWARRITAMREAIALLKTHPEALPNEPLTLEELREMEGKPIWIKKLTGYGVSEYGIVHLCPPPDVADPKVIRVVNGAFGFEQILPYPKNKKQQKYGNTWIAYRRPPKED